MTGLDGLLAFRVAAGLVVPQVPGLPSTSPPARVLGGQDPLIWIPTNFEGEAGQSIAIPVRLLQTDTNAVELG